MAEVPEVEIDAAIMRMAEPTRPFADKGEKAKAGLGDRVTVDFVGRIAGVEFEGGKGQNIQVVIARTPSSRLRGSAVGIKTGETKLIKGTFPAKLCGRPACRADAEFDVTAKTIEAPVNS